MYTHQVEGGFKCLIIGYRFRANAQNKCWMVTLMKRLGLTDFSDSRELSTERNWLLWVCGKQSKEILVMETSWGLLNGDHKDRANRTVPIVVSF